MEDCWSDGQAREGGGTWGTFDSSKDILENGHRSGDEGVTVALSNAEESDFGQVALD